MAHIVCAIAMMRLPPLYDPILQAHTCLRVLFFVATYLMFLAASTLCFWAFGVKNNPLVRKSAVNLLKHFITKTLGYHFALQFIWPLIRRILRHK